MKYKIDVQIHKSGSENDSILKVVANMNEGKGEISIIQIAGYLHTMNLMYPSIKELAFKCYGDTLHISEDKGKTYTLTLTWKEVHELSETEKEVAQELEGRDDLKNVL